MIFSATNKEEKFKTLVQRLLQQGLEDWLNLKKEIKNCTGRIKRCKIMKVNRGPREKKHNVPCTPFQDKPQTISSR